MAQVRTVQTAEGLEVPEPGTWVIDPAHSTVSFTARHLMVTKVRGRFDRFSVTIHVGEVPEHSWVEVDIDAASIDTNEAKRDAHLRSPDFLDAPQYPALRFRSTAIEPVGQGQFRLIGDLTIRDVTRPVVLDVEYLGAVTNAMGEPRVAFSATTEIDREEFGITWNVALETGGVLVSKRVQIEIEVQATPLAATEEAA